MSFNYRLIVLSTNFRGEKFKLTNKKITCGRSATNDIRLPDRTVSSHHCDFQLEEKGGYVIVDKGSANGILVNNVPVQSRKLRDMDILQIGAVELLCDWNGNTFGASGIRHSDTMETEMEKTELIRRNVLSRFASKLSASNASLFSWIAIFIVSALIMIFLYVILFHSHR